MPTEAELEAQKRFEVEAFDQGVARYREAALSKDLTELTAGQLLLLEIVKPLAVAIARARTEGSEAITNPVGRKQPWAWPVQLVEDPERMAVIVVGAVLSTPVLEHDDDHYGLSRTHMPITPLTRHIATAIRMQVEYDRWAEGNEALARRLRKQFPNLHRNVWRRWRTKVDALREEPWPAAVEVSLGGHLLGLLVQVAPTRFRVENITTKGKSVAHLVLSEDTLELLDDVTTRMEVCRPLYMPMICEPLPWRYE